MATPTRRHADEKSLSGSVARDVEKIQAQGKAEIEMAEHVSYTPEEEKAIIRKLDYNVLPLVFVLYSISVLDRSNLGNAKIAGMQDDIDLSGGRYEWLATIFYISYIVFQFVCIGWKIVKPHIWITAAVVGWGLIATLQSAATSWSGLMACRFLLGITEAMFGPGVGLYLAYFYPRQKLGFRLGVFISGAALANAYGSALAYGISHINSNIGNWQLLFIIEGVPSCLLGLITWFFVPDSPGTCRFLNEREKKIATAIAHQQPGDFEYEGLNIKQFFSAGMDYRSYFTAMMYFGCNVSFASLPLFLPTIVSELGEFTQIQSNGLSAPPYLACFFVIIIASILSDRLGVRGPFVVFFASVSAVGFLLLGVTTGTGPRYFALFLAVNSFVCVALILPWVANNNSTDSNRTGGYWILQTIGQCGPLLGTNVFPAKDAPYYRKGSFISMGFSLLVAVLAAILVVLLWRENRRRDKKYGRVQDTHIEVGADANEDPNFRYVL